VYTRKSRIQKLIKGLKSVLAEKPLGKPIEIIYSLDRTASVFKRKKLQEKNNGV